MSFSKDLQITLIRNEKKNFYSRIFPFFIACQGCSLHLKEENLTRIKLIYMQSNLQENFSELKQVFPLFFLNFLQKASEEFEIIPPNIIFSLVY